MQGCLVFFCFSVCCEDATPLNSDLALCLSAWRKAAEMFNIGILCCSWPKALQWLNCHCLLEIHSFVKPAFGVKGSFLLVCCFGAHINFAVMKQLSICQKHRFMENDWSEIAKIRLWLVVLMECWEKVALKKNIPRVLKDLTYVKFWNVIFLLLKEVFEKNYPNSTDVFVCMM